MFKTRPCFWTELERRHILRKSRCTSAPVSSEGKLTLSIFTQQQGNSVSILGIPVDIFALGIGVLAFLQPWIVEFWRDKFRKGSVTIHPADWVQVGYGGIGPNVRLVGNLRALVRDQFVQGMTLNVFR